MTTELIILVIVVLTALAFDFTNGFHDTGNAMATSIATGALKPKTAVALSASLNLVGAFLSVEVAKTVGKGLVDLDQIDIKKDGSALMLIVFTGLVGGILWNVLTWLLGLPSSSSHALFGGLIGSALAALGFSGVQWGGVLSKIVIPLCHLWLPRFSQLWAHGWYTVLPPPSRTRGKPVASDGGRWEPPPSCRWRTVRMTPRKLWA